MGEVHHGPKLVVEKIAKNMNLEIKREGSYYYWLDSKKGKKKVAITGFFRFKKEVEHRAIAINGIIRFNSDNSKRPWTLEIYGRCNLEQGEKFAANIASATGMDVLVDLESEKQQYYCQKNHYQSISWDKCPFTGSHRETFYE